MIGGQIIIWAIALAAIWTWWAIDRGRR